MMVHRVLVSGISVGYVVPVDLPETRPQGQHIDADLNRDWLQLRQVFVAPVFKPGRKLDALAQFVW